MKYKYVLIASLVIIAVFLAVNANNHSETPIDTVIVNSNEGGNGVTKNENIQQNIQSFLETDTKYGNEARGYVSERAESARIDNERIAVTELVRKLKQHDCRHLPSDFCSAYTNHVSAWDNYSQFLENTYITNGPLPNSFATNSQYMQMNETILSTYNTMTDIAHGYGAEYTE